MTQNCTAIKLIESIFIGICRLFHNFTLRKPRIRLMKTRQQAENTIEFAKDKVIIYLTKAIYEAIEKIARTKYTDARSVRGVVQTYAVIQLYSRLGCTNTFVPIHRDIFQYISKRNYIDYRELLCQRHIIEYQKGELTTYKTIKGEHRVSCSTTAYRMASVIGVLFDNDRTIPVPIPLPSDYVAALREKHKHIEEVYADSEGKSRSIMEINPMDIGMVKQIVSLIKAITTNKIKTKRTLEKRIAEISTINKRINADSDVCDIIKRIIRVIDNKQIVENKLLYLFVKQLDNKTNNCSDNWGYYRELKVKMAALDECLTKRDLTHLARINTVPSYGNEDKIYSALANIRKPIREYVLFRGFRLVEASDVSCAHFTMLPVIFKRYNITIPSDELQRWIDLTQKGDLYSAVVEDREISRSKIKAIFQPFLSIKNKNQFLYGQEGNERIYREAICEFFEERFPAIFNALLSWHTVTNVSIKSMANRVESDIMNPICEKLIVHGLHPFRIHDAIYLPENELPNIPFDIKEEVMASINRAR